MTLQKALVLGLASILAACGGGGGGSSGGSVGGSPPGNGSPGGDNPGGDDPGGEDPGDNPEPDGETRAEFLFPKTGAAATASTITVRGIASDPEGVAKVMVNGRRAK